MPMYLIEIFLPRCDNEGQPFPGEMFDLVREELAHQFGGVTAFVRSPAIGIWRDDRGAIRRDEIVIFEVMTADLHREWWKDYRKQMEERFRQDEVMTRVTVFEKI